MPRISTYWHTVRHLRPVQLYGRLLARFPVALPPLREAPPVRALPPGRWAEPVPRPRSFVAPDRFEFLNQAHELAAGGWDDPSLDRLWRYNLHYFDDLSGPASAEHAASQHALMRRWVRENPVREGTAWESYPTSLRIVNWIKWAWAGHQLPTECMASLALQASWLSRRLEVHLLGNHLFANAKALVFAGLFFEGPDAARWLAMGLAILAREIPEQILADGGHFERSPMYHALALEDMLDLHNALRAHLAALSPHQRSFAAALPDRLGDMRRWLDAMCHPDGEIGFFNDAAFGIAPRPSTLEQYATRLGLPPVPAIDGAESVLQPSGYVRITSGAAVALLDVAPIGPDYLPGHAHADTLSFELSLFGQRVLVNSGTSCYGTGAERQRQRGTAAHNTVVVDNTDSSEVWAGFRVARRAYPRRLHLSHESGVVVSCAHDGYRWLPGRPEHERRWTFTEDAVTVEDQVSGRFGTAEARFHLHPGVRILEPGQARDSVETMTLMLPEGQRVRLSVERGRGRLVATTWHPTFGASIPNLCVSVALDGGASRLRLTWSIPA